MLIFIYVSDLLNKDGTFVSFGAFKHINPSSFISKWREMGYNYWQTSWNKMFGTTLNTIPNTS